MQGELNIVVCMKQVPDPEGPSSSYEVDSDNKKVIPKGIPPVMSPFDENALEAAVKLKEKHGGKVTILSVGCNLSKPVLLKAVAVGADEILTIEDDSCDRESIDGFQTASHIAAAVAGMERVDLVITGRQAADTNAGIVGAGIAEFLNMPLVTLAQRIELTEGKLNIERVMPDGFEVVSTTLPAVITVSHEIGEIRYPKMSDIKLAKSKPHKTMKPSDLDANYLKSEVLDMTELKAPQIERDCVMIKGDNADETGALLAKRLREDKVI